MPWAYPIPAVKSIPLKDSFDRKIIPGSDPPKQYARGAHYSIDIDGDCGHRIVAVHAGTVIDTGIIGGLEALGRQVLIRYRDSLGRARYHRYCHCDMLMVKRGQKVKRAQGIATCGKTGQAGGCHLHFEWSKSPEWPKARALLNPFRALERARRA